MEKKYIIFLWKMKILEKKKDITWVGIQIFKIDSNEPQQKKFWGKIWGRGRKGNQVFETFGIYIKYFSWGHESCNELEKQLYLALGVL